MFPDSTHVVHLGMDRDDDLDIWNHALNEDFVIVTKDKDFLQRSVLVGHPPKVIHLTLGNCPAQKIADLILKEKGQLKAFGKHASKSYLLLP